MGPLRLHAAFTEAAETKEGKHPSQGFKVSRSGLQAGTRYQFLQHTETLYTTRRLRDRGARVRSGNLRKNIMGYLLHAQRLRSLKLEANAVRAWVHRPAHQHSEVPSEHRKCLPSPTAPQQLRGPQSHQAAAWLTKGTLGPFIGP